MSTDFSIRPRGSGDVRDKEDESIQKLRLLRHPLFSTNPLLMAFGASRLISVTESSPTIMAGGAPDHGGLASFLLE